MEIFNEFGSNWALIATAATGLIAQGFKVFVNAICHRQFDFKWFFETGGMPSSHSAFVSGMATTVGLHAGFDSVVSVVALTVATIVIYDAAGVRRAVGKQAGILNEIVALRYKHEEVPHERLKELIGHTPIEVFLGVLFGIFVAMLFSINEAYRLFL